VNVPGEMHGLPVDARHGQGIAVGSHITQYNYFINSSEAPGFRGRRAPGQAGGSALRVLISSAPGALGPYRHAAAEVCYRLGMIPVYMGEFDPQRPPPAEVSRGEVDRCDVFVLLLAHRYGPRPPGERLSYTELEYQRAMSRPGLPLLAFVVDPAFAWPPPDIDRDEDAAALARFAGQVRDAHTVGRLAELAAFREDLLLALSRFQGTVPLAGSPAEEQEDPQHETWVPAPPEFHAVPPYVGGAPFTGRAGDLDLLDEWAGSADPVMVVEAIGGTGKSALTWQWAQQRAHEVIPGLAGRLWWSFYEGSASMTRFLQELLAYASGQPMRQIRRLNQAELADQALVALRGRRYLLVLDGFERLLTAYHRYDPTKLRDEEVKQDERSLIEPQADDFVRRLAAAGPSKILISTRLMPTALQGRFGQQVPGVRQLRLPGLTDTDTRTLLARLDVRGSQRAVAGFFGPLGNHPLLLGIVAGLVRDYRAEPGGFDRWLADPTAGGALHVSDLNLSQRRSHILAVALTELSAGSRRVLGWISALSGKVAWTTLEGINPFQPVPPAPVEADLTSLGNTTFRFEDGYENWVAAVGPLRAEAERRTQEQLKAWQDSQPDARVKAQLDAALTDLEERGLLWWDRSSNSYDLHPIIRAYTYDQLEGTDRIEANDRIRDHFRALPPEDLERAANIEDLSQTITIFRALVGAGHLDDAVSLWERTLGTVLFDALGAYPTVIELLTPIVKQGAMSPSGDLGIAYNLVGQHEEAISLRKARLAQVLDAQNTRKARFSPDIPLVRSSLDDLSLYFQSAGRYAVSSRYLDLWADLNTAIGDEADARLHISLARRALAQGEVRQSSQLLEQAKIILRSDPRGVIAVWQLQIAMYELSLTHAQLDRAASWIDDWLNCRNLVDLRCELFIQQGQFRQALSAAEEYERLGRSAGRDVPARSAYLLAKLGRAAEATAAVEESLARLPGIHQARRPHYYLARALWELGSSAEAVSQAQQAYHQAWGDGPPHCDHWDLRDARELLHVMRVPVPELPVFDPAVVRAPLEDEIRAFIAALATASGRPRSPRRPDRLRG